MEPELPKYQSTHPYFREWPPRSVPQLTTLQDSGYDADDSGDSPIRDYQDLPNMNESSHTLNQPQLRTSTSSNVSINDSVIFFNSAGTTNTNSNTKKKRAKKIPVNARVKAVLDDLGDGRMNVLDVLDVMLTSVDFEMHQIKLYERGGAKLKALLDKMVLDDL